MSKKITTYNNTNKNIGIMMYKIIILFFTKTSR